MLSISLLFYELHVFCGYNFDRQMSDLSNVDIHFMFGLLFDLYISIGCLLLISSASLLVILAIMLYAMLRESCLGLISFWL